MQNSQWWGVGEKRNYSTTEADFMKTRKIRKDGVSKSSFCLIEDVYSLAVGITPRNTGQNFSDWAPGEAKEWLIKLCVLFRSEIKDLLISSVRYMHCDCALVASLYVCTQWSKSVHCFSTFLSFFPSFDSSDLILLTGKALV